MTERDELIIIPARFRSTRLPGKPLVDIAGKPMIVRTASQCFKAVDRDDVVVATDSEEIARVCDAHGIWAELTRDDHPTGGDRVAEIASRIPAKTYINVQGDEPVFNPQDVTTLIEHARRDRTKSLIGYCEMTEEEWHDTKNLRLIFGLQDQLIYIGRGNVPGSHDGKFRFGYRQVCIYAYPGETLKKFASTNGRTRIELIEDNEIMRFLELGLPVHVVELSNDSISVDRPQDVIRASERVRELEAL